MVQRLTAALAIAFGVGAGALWRAGAGAAPQPKATSAPVPGASGVSRSDSLPEGASGREIARKRTNDPALAAAFRDTPADSLAPAGSLAPADLDEPTFMAHLRSVARTDPALAVELAREGGRRFADSSDAAERASLLIHALARLGRGSEARGEAEDVVNDYPDSPWIREIEQFTGAHRHRNVRIGADGGIEVY
jgi:hypothetical protein